MSNNLHFSTENLLTMLEQLKHLIQDGTIPIDTQQQIWDSLMWDKSDVDKDLMKYIITGWWVHYNIKGPM